jgi:soluble lytic murein transglycosylase-like protein
LARSFVRDLVIAIGAAAVLFTAAHARPEHRTDLPVVDQLMHVSAADSLGARFPWATAAPKDTATLASPQFVADRDAFKADLLRTGKVDPDRAEQLATIAVREAYRRQLPPALVFGVMMVENPDLESRARSHVGAVGLMQIYPRAWVGTLGPIFGRDLRDDETNIRYGVYILSHLVRSGSDWLDADSTLRRGLLRYNGCVKGTNTRDCFRYPDKVRDRVERLALAQCGEGGFDGCVADPMRLHREDAQLTW